MATLPKVTLYYTELRITTVKTSIYRPDDLTTVIKSAVQYYYPDITEPMKVRYQDEQTSISFEVKHVNH